MMKPSDIAGFKAIEKNATYNYISPLVKVDLTPSSTNYKPNDPLQLSDKSTFFLPKAGFYGECETGIRPTNMLQDTKIYACGKLVLYSACDTAFNGNAFTGITLKASSTTNVTVTPGKIWKVNDQTKAITEGTAFLTVNKAVAAT